SVMALSKVNAVAAQEAENITQPHGDLLRSRADLYAPFSDHFSEWGLVYAVLALLVLSISNIRIGIAVSFLCIYFGAYPGLLYEFRHFFYLAFVPYWACGYLISKVYRWTYGLLRNLYKKEFNALRMQFRPKKIALGIGFVTALVLALGFSLVVLRFVQEQRMDTLLIRYANAALTPVETVWSTEGDNVLLRPLLPLPGLEGTPELPGFESTGEYMALSLKHTGHPLFLRILYKDLPMVDFSQWATPHPGLIGKSGNYTFFFPVYQLAWPEGEDVVRGKFMGLLIPEQYRHAVKGLYRVKNSDEFALWPFMALAKHKSAFLIHKTGPFERFLAAGRVELGSLFGWNYRAAVSGYQRLIRKYPG
ncbi:MAG: hypothetical protein KAH38_12360, partial [Candidatus Hydrogenedentes bacterium]|nr:hypothetical protein [Candidatus Hydrogenedentota bacterium]